MRLTKLEECERLENSFIEFFQAAWPEIDPAPLSLNWHHEAIAEHLEAVAYGKIRKLLINVPPRHTKTLLASVAFPAWLWCREPDEDYPLIGPQAKFLCLSYSDQLVMDNATLAHRLVISSWYQERWGHRVKIAKDQDAKNKFDTQAGGTRISASFGGSVLGRGGDIKIIDDPHKVDEAESDVTRERVLRAYDGTLKSRITDPRTAAEIIIMQRLHQNDLAGHVLDSDEEFVHLNLPAEYEGNRRCVTVLGWEDPRQNDGDLLWEGRFDDKALSPFRANPYEWSGQWQQSPEPRGGGIIKREYWRIWDRASQEANDVKPGMFPNFEFVLASFDGAFTEKKENDYSALTIWGVWVETSLAQRYSEQFGTPRLMLIWAWHKRLTLHGQTDIEQWPGETKAEFEARRRQSWGVVEHIAADCKKHHVDKLIIENKANGITVEQEMRRLFSREPWTVALHDPGRMDKAARAYTVQHLFSDGLIWRPDTDWAQLVEDELASLPRGAHDDLADASINAIIHLRRMNLAQRKDESFAAIESMLFPEKPKRKLLYEM